MLLSEVIKKLQIQLNNQGDAPVKVLAYNTVIGRYVEFDEGIECRYLVETKAFMITGVNGPKHRE